MAGQDQGGASSAPTPLDLPRLAALAAAATVLSEFLPLSLESATGPSGAVHVLLRDCLGFVQADMTGDEKTPFDEALVTAVNAVPALIARVRELETEVELERGALRVGSLDVQKLHDCVRKQAECLAELQAARNARAAAEKPRAALAAQTARVEKLERVAEAAREYFKLRTEWLARDRAEAQRIDKDEAHNGLHEALAALDREVTE